jgi:Cytochrome P460
MRRFYNLKTFAIALVAIVGCGFVVAFSQAQPADTEEPQYTAAGELRLPGGIDKWIFVGSNRGLSYKPDAPAMTAAEMRRADAPNFHNVYITPRAYNYFLANKTFPDKTMLAMQVYESADKEPKQVLATGSFNGEHVGLEMAVKNMNRPDGSKTPWAYYNFSGANGLKPSAKAFEDGQCENCHKIHASLDHVWVQFYPVLRDPK